MRAVVRRRGDDREFGASWSSATRGFVGVGVAARSGDGFLFSSQAAAGAGDGAASFLGFFENMAVMGTAALVTDAFFLGGMLPGFGDAARASSVAAR